MNPLYPTYKYRYEGRRNLVKGVTECRRRTALPTPTYYVQSRTGMVPGTVPGTAYVVQSWNYVPVVRCCTYLVLNTVPWYRWYCLVHSASGSLSTGSW